MREEKYDDLMERKKTWSKNNEMWKEFVKLARWEGLVPDDKKLFWGLLHDCESTVDTETDTCSEPIPDRDRWVQYCMTNPRLLGNKYIFIEFDVDWNEWVHPSSWDSVNEGS